jgi:hypothetical protein
MSTIRFGNQWIVRDLGVSVGRIRAGTQGQNGDYPGEDAARGAGLGVLSLEERRDNWRQAVLKLKGFIEPYGIGFPALPEVGIDGRTVAFDPEDLIPVF